MRPPEPSSPNSRPRTDAGFRGYFAFLSNFHPCQMRYGGIVFGNSEAAFQSAKFSDPSFRTRFQGLTGPEAKQLGKTRHPSFRADWDEVKLDMMASVLRMKFRDPALRELLKATQGVDLVEVNNWGDTFFGECGGVGQNNLGKILMALRAEYVSYAQAEVIPASQASVAVEALASLSSDGLEEGEPEKPALVLIRMPSQGPETIANRIAKYAVDMGLDAKAFCSRLSSSCYVEVGGSAKIRISGHESRPTYNKLHGAADFEVALPWNTHQDADGGWAEAVRWIAQTFEKPLPDQFVKRVASREKAMATQRERELSKLPPEEVAHIAQRTEENARRDQVVALADLLQHDERAFEFACTLGPDHEDPEITAQLQAILGLTAKSVDRLKLGDWIMATGIVGSRRAQEALREKAVASEKAWNERHSRQTKALVGLLTRNDRAFELAQALPVPGGYGSFYLGSPKDVIFKANATQIQALGGLKDEDVNLLSQQNWIGARRRASKERERLAWKTRKVALKSPPEASHA